MDSLSDLFQQLDERIKSDDHSAAVEVSQPLPTAWWRCTLIASAICIRPCAQVCDQILAAAPGDTDALHVKVCSLIELSKTEEALQVLAAAPRPARAYSDGRHTAGAVGTLLLACLAPPAPCAAF